MIALLGLFSGSSLKYIGILAALAGLAFGTYWVVQQHDQNVLLTQQVTQQKANMAAVEVQHSAEIAALQDAAAKAQARDTKFSNLKQKVASVPVRTSCASSPAVVSALAGLRVSPVRVQHPAPSPTGKPSRPQ